MSFFSPSPTRNEWLTFAIGKALSDRSCCTRHRMACLNICELLRQIEICLLELLRFWADDEQTRSYSGPQVRFEEVGSQSDVFQTQVVIHRMSQFLFAAQIFFMCCST